MDVRMSAKATVAAPGEMDGAGHAGRLTSACDAAWCRNRDLPEGLSASPAAAALPGLPWTPPKVGAGRVAATALANNTSHPNVHNTL